MRFSHYWLSGLILALAPALASADYVVQVGQRTTASGGSTTNNGQVTAATFSGLPITVSNSGFNTGSSWAGTASAEQFIDMTPNAPISESVQFKMTNNVVQTASTLLQTANSTVAWSDTLTIASQANQTVDLVFTLSGTIDITETGGDAGWQLYSFEPRTLAADKITNAAYAPNRTLLTSITAPGIGQTFSDTFTKSVTLDGSGNGIIDLQFTSEVKSQGSGNASADLSNTIQLTSIISQTSGNPIGSASFASGLTFTAVPEPGSFLLLASIGGVGGVIRRRRRPAVV